MFDDDDIPSNSSNATSFQDVARKRLSRRSMLGGLTGLTAMGVMPSIMVAGPAVANAKRSTLTFNEIKHVYDERHHVSDGYSADILIRWGDPVEADAPRFDPNNLTASAAEKQFGYNCDYVGFMPLPIGSLNGEQGLLCVNHEYTTPQLMFDGITNYWGAAKITTNEQVNVEMAVTGHSIIEVSKKDGKWSTNTNSRYNRRIHAKTKMRLSGPAAGHERLKTKEDPSGLEVYGTINNCAGGVTPWGTVLIAEENFHKYFSGNPSALSEADNFKRYGIKNKPDFGWGRFHDRFHVQKEPNEFNRFGWMVEIDPYDPLSVPVKRTALGRFKHEGATIAVNNDGRVVAYSGDDQRFEYVYKFVSNGQIDPNNREANRDLLDDGTLFVARFKVDGSLDWLPLVWEVGPLTPKNGFDSQADILIETRKAADLMKATPMDRPEDIEPNPVTGRVYVMLTKNNKRKDDETNIVNPRPNNKHGHIVEMIPPGYGKDADHAALKFTWEIPLLAGDPKNVEDGAKYNSGVSEHGWLSTPDNCAFDSKGRLWISTDGASKTGFADGVWATDVEGPGRMLTRHFFAAPRGAEFCGPTLTPDDRTFFGAVQHPADEKGSTFSDPTTRWPDFKKGMPPRPSVVVITKNDQGVIGS